mmetsp:Transcript_16029/g.23788  ORF Transcript_16029/g.23788 Transcript_16029/m.23788 type:complete len:398 (+) Transcript_16029:68-1261(+)
MNRFNSEKIKKEGSDGFNTWVKLPISGKGPSPRSGHDVAVIDNKAYLFGGCGGDGNDKISCLNDVYAFDLDTHKWEEVRINGQAPLPRASFGMCAGPRQESIIIAGGTGVEMDSLRTDIVEFDARTRTCRKIITDSEETPCRFYGQSVCTYNQSLLMFGGSTGMHYTNDLYEYSTVGHKWRKLQTTGNKPSPRYKHQAIVAGDCMYIIGGGCFKPEQSLIDVHCLDFLTLRWNEVKSKGEVPESRVAHSCCYDPSSSTIYLWGGFTSELSRLQDFFALDCTTGTWRAISPKNTKHLFSAPAISACGGEQPYLPPARAFHAATFHKGSLYLFSGANGDVRYNDIWRYQVYATPPKLSTLAAKKLHACHIDKWQDVAWRLPLELVDGMLGMNEYATALM